LADTGLPDRRACGASVEVAARRHLLLAGLEDVASNAGFRAGEIDLVMLDPDARGGPCLVFVEVRYRSASRFGDGVDSVSAAKCAKLVRAASAFLAGHSRLAAATCRFDVLAIGECEGASSIDWRQNAFEAC
jgi:putative endonuclease